jgi:phosphatidylserine decarboxylase
MIDFKIAPEGYPFLLGSLLVTCIAALFLFWSWRTSGGAGLVSALFISLCFLLCITAFMAYFFRDPERIVPEGRGLFVSPADGKVILVKDVYEKGYLQADAKEISIFMSPLNVHVNRAPCTGKVTYVKHTPGQFIAAYKDDASIKNENIVMALEGEQGRVLVRQVAGFVARRAVCRVKPGDLLKRGERYGMIKFGSRLDVYLPADAQILVKPGDKILAGETVIAAIPRTNRE